MLIWLQGGGGRKLCMALEIGWPSVKLIKSFKVYPEMAWAEWNARTLRESSSRDLQTFPTFEKINEPNLCWDVRQVFLKIFATCIEPMMIYGRVPNFLFGPIVSLAHFSVLIKSADAKKVEGLDAGLNQIKQDTLASVANAIDFQVWCHPSTPWRVWPTRPLRHKTVQMV